MRKKIVITLDEQFIEDIDRLVSEHVFLNRSQAVQEAVEEKLKRHMGYRMYIQMVE